MFITTIHSIDSLEKLKRAKADAVIIGVEHYSIRSSITVKKEDLQLWKKKCKKLGLKLYINFLRLCMDEDLSGVREYFSIFKELDVDGIYYADEGLYFEAKQLGIESKLIYQPETLVASSADVDFYMLVTNYLEAVNKPKCLLPCHYDLIEQTRDKRMPIVQDESGTHIFSEMPINSLQEMWDFTDVGMHRFRIDSLFFDDDWTVEILGLYDLALQGIKITDDESTNRWYLEETIKKKEEQVNE